MSLGWDKRMGYAGTHWWVTWPWAWVRELQSSATLENGLHRARAQDALAWTLASCKGWFHPALSQQGTGSSLPVWGTVGSSVASWLQIEPAQLPNRSHCCWLQLSSLSTWILCFMSACHCLKKFFLYYLFCHKQLSAVRGLSAVTSKGCSFAKTWALRQWASLLQAQ